MTLDPSRSGETLCVRFNTDQQSSSMKPFLWPGDQLYVQAVTEEEVQRGDILIFQAPGGRLLAHRLVRKETRTEGNLYIMRGDNCRQPDPPISFSMVIGKVINVRRGKKLIAINTAVNRALVRGWNLLHPLPLILAGAVQKLRPS